MNKGLYKSSVDKIKFDEELEGKTLNYIKERGSKMNNTKKSKWKMKISASTAVAVCSVCVLSATAYAAVVNFNNVEHSKYGFVSKESISESKESNNQDDLGEFLNTSEIRSKMNEEDSDIKLVSEEKNVDGVNWVMKSVFKDESKAYTSDDKINWEVDKSQGEKFITEYSYDNYEKAINDAKMPNVMNNILSKVDSSKGAFLEEYSSENKEEISRKRVVGEFDYKKGKISVDLSKYLNENSGYNVITGIDKATNQREYKSKDGNVFKLSDSTEGSLLKTTTMISSGELCLIMQFENISDKDIHTILDSLDLSEFGI